MFFKKEDFGFNKEELSVLRKLNTPQKIQDFLNSLKINFEENGETCMSPRMVLKTGKAHCMEGAMLAAAALRLHGHPPLILDMETTPEDEDHVVTLFKTGNHWGAIGKTNHSVLRYREPIYKTTRELVLSFFHEYFMEDTRKKTLRRYSSPINLARFDKLGWMTSKDDIWYIPDYLSKINHKNLLSRKQARNLRKTDDIEVRAFQIKEYEKEE